MQKVFFKKIFRKIISKFVVSTALFLLLAPQAFAAVIAGAGMSHGGRIREHEREYLGRPTTTVLFVGYQAPGSLGRRLQEGARVIELDGVTVRVRARMDTLSGYSGHADRDQLVDFAAAADTAERIFVVMGEPKASQFLAQRIRDFIGIDTLVPVQGQTVEIQW
jgi:metallo-beta-lactamase family protein